MARSCKCNMNHTNSSDAATFAEMSVMQPALNRTGPIKRQEGKRLKRFRRKYVKWIFTGMLNISAMPCRQLNRNEINAEGRQKRSDVNEGGSVWLLLLLFLLFHLLRSLCTCHPKFLATTQMRPLFMLSGIVHFEINLWSCYGHCVCVRACVRRLWFELFSGWAKKMFDT